MSAVFHRLISHRALGPLAQVAAAKPRLAFRLVPALWGVLARAAFHRLERLGGLRLRYPVLFCRGNRRVARLITALSRSGPHFIAPFILAGLPSLRPLASGGVGSRDESLGALVALATQEVPFSKDIFVRSFADPEDLFAANRFNWLLQMVEQEGDQAIRSGFQRIRVWLETVDPEGRPEAFEPYSISDRLLAWLFFIMLADERPAKEDVFWTRLAESVSLQLSLLAERLEYHGRYTNNHVLNNARALYICGRFLSLPGFEALGRAVLEFESDRVIRHGIVQEDSSHYQMIIAKWFLETLLAAQLTGDSAMLAWLTPRLSAMLAVCQELQGSFEAPELPLFGDVSPDFHPRWLVGYPFRQEGSRPCPWWRLFGGRLELPEVPATPPPPSKEASRWLHIRWGDYELWIMAKGRGIRCHGHDDNGSMVLSCRGRQIILDPGRSSYMAGELAERQVSRGCHNLGGPRDAIFDLPQPTPSGAPSLASTFELLRMDADAIKYSVTSFDGSARVIRSITRRGERIVVEAQAEGAGDHCCTLLLGASRYEARSPGLTVFPGPDGEFFQIASPSGIVHRPDVVALRSPSYGAASTCLRLELESREASIISFSIGRCDG